MLATLPDWAWARAVGTSAVAAVVARKFLRFSVGVFIVRLLVYPHPNPPFQGGGNGGAAFLSCCPSTAFDLRDEENFGAGFYRLTIGDLVQFAVDGDCGFFLEMFAKPRE